MLGKGTPRMKRKARTFLLDDSSTIQSIDRPPFETYAEYPEKKHALIRLPRPFRKQQKVIENERKKKGIHDSGRFLVEFDARDKKLVATPDGIFAIHILELENVSLRVTNFDRSVPMFFYCVIVIGKKRKMTKTVLSYTPDRVRVDSTLYFPIEISNTRENYRNKLKFEIWAFQDVANHFIIGTKEIHIFTLIQTVHSIDKVRIWADGLLAASFIYEYAFAYGTFGFGHSNQLKNTKSSVFESICYSMFPRIRLTDEDLIDNKFNIRVPRKIQMMDTSNFLLYSAKHAREQTAKDPDFQPKFFALHHVEFDRGEPIFAKVNMNIYQEEFEADFNEIYGEFICMSSRKHRLEFLKALVNGRSEDIQETEVGALFQSLDDDIAEEIIRSEDNQDFLVYPRRTPCTVSAPAFVEPSDEKTFYGLPSISRSPGFLARLFGYEPINSDPHHGEEEYPFTYLRRYTKHRTPRCQICMMGLRLMWGKFIGMIYSFLAFIFPDLRSEVKIPDIAVTLPSPQGSTTDLYVSWVTDERQQVAYMTATRRLNDPVQEAHDAVSKLLYDEYERDIEILDENKDDKVENSDGDKLKALPVSENETAQPPNQKK